MIAYHAVLTKFWDEFGEKAIDGATSDQILDFLNRITEGTKQQTRRIRYAHLPAFFNFITANIDPDSNNPCSTPILRKMFKAKAIPAREIIEKDVIDEIIFRTDKPRDRLILELMARGKMRIGEVLKLTPADVQKRKLMLKNPKSGKRREHVFVPQKVNDSLMAYIRDNNIQPN